MQTSTDALIETGSTLLSAVARLNRWATAQATTPFDMPYAQLRVVSLIEQLGPVRITELAEADNCSQPTITQQVRKLAERGWIDRADDPEDARASLISLSAKGHEIVAQARAARAAAIAPLLMELDDADRDTLRATTDLLVRLCDRATKISRDPHPHREFDRGAR